jgi:hypothetical protein
MPATVGLFGGPENGGESLVWSGLEQGKEPGSNILWGFAAPDQWETNRTMASPSIPVARAISFG